MSSKKRVVTKTVEKKLVTKVEQKLVTKVEHKPSICVIKETEVPELINELKAGLNGKGQVLYSITEKQTDSQRANPQAQRKKNKEVMMDPVYKFPTMEMLSLYITMSLKQMVNNKLVPRKNLSELVTVVENNLKVMDVDRQWFLATLRDHARIYHEEWLYNTNEKVQTYVGFESQAQVSPCLNVKRDDKGLQEYNKLLLILSLKLGLEKKWVPVGHTEFDIRDLKKELEAIYSPEVPNLNIKHLTQCTPLFEFLFKFSTNVETINLPRSNEYIFPHSCRKFKNLRVIEFNGDVPDQDICSALWGVSESSEVVLNKALKNRGKIKPNLPHLEVLRSNILLGASDWVPTMQNFAPFSGAIEMYQNIMPEFTKRKMKESLSSQVATMQLSLGAAALILQPAMSIVENVNVWDTMKAVHYLLEKSVRQKNSNDLILNLKSLKLAPTLCIDAVEMRRLMKACPHVDTLTLPDFPVPELQIISIVEYVPMKNIVNLVLDTMRLPGEDLLRLLAQLPNLEKLTLHIWDAECMQFIGASELSKKILTELESSPRLRTLSLEFKGMLNDPDKSKAKDMIAFLNCFPTVTKLNLYQTMFIPPSFLINGCLCGALASMMNLKHMSIVAMDPVLPFDIPIIAQLVQPKFYQHIPDVIATLPSLMDERPFAHLSKLSTFELDEIYVAPRVDRLIEALRNEGVAVSINYRIHHDKKYEYSS